MSQARRDFLKLGLTQLVALNLPRKGDAQETAPLRRAGPSILQGATDETNTQFSVVHDAGETFDFFVIDRNGHERRADDVELRSMKNQTRRISKPRFSGLRPGVDYQLELRDEKGRVRDRRIFQTLDLSRSSLKFAICSCMDEDNHDPLIWRDLVQQRPDVIFFIGDSVYADKEAHAQAAATPAILWRRFCEARATLEIYFSERLIPILAVWDDHDFGLNDSDSTNYPYVKESQRNFLSFFAQDPETCSVMERGPGISSCFRIRSHLIVLMDDRSFRQPRGSKERYAHWGAAQEKWMLNQVRNHRGPIWLMNGSQFFPSVRWKESVSGDHPVQFRGLLDELRKTGQRMLFASGDVHYSEISQIESSALGFETFEVTSSSMHSPCLPGAPWIVPNPRRIEGSGRRNYILVTSKLTAAGAQVLVESRGASGALFFARRLS